MSSDRRPSHQYICPVPVILCCTHCALAISIAACQLSDATQDVTKTLHFFVSKVYRLRLGKLVEMSSAGARPAGSDGADYMHRERVANQHTDSVRYKAQLARYLWPLACAQLFSFAMVCSVVVLCSDRSTVVYLQLIVTLMNRPFVQCDWACLFRAAMRCLIVLSLLGTLLMMRAMPRNDSAKMQSGMHSSISV